MKKYFSNNLVEQSVINKMVLRRDEDIKLLQDSFDKINDIECINKLKDYI